MCLENWEKLNEVNSDIKKLENINLNIFLGYIWAELVNRSVTVVKLYRNPDRILSISHLKDSLDYYGFIRGFYEEVNLFTYRLHQNYLFGIFQIVFEYLLLWSINKLIVYYF